MGPNISGPSLKRFALLMQPDNQNQRTIQLRLFGILRGHEFE